MSYLHYYKHNFAPEKIDLPFQLKINLFRQHFFVNVLILKHIQKHLVHCCIRIVIIAKTAYDLARGVDEYAGGYEMYRVFLADIIIRITAIQYIWP